MRVTAHIISEAPRRGEQASRCRRVPLDTLRCAWLLLAVTLLPVCTAQAQGQDVYFGQNKVQYKDFIWQHFQTEHFDIYYHQGGQELAEFAAVASEEAYRDLRRRLRFELTERVPIILYNSHNDFQQTNVTSGILQEGIGGFTEFLKNRVVVPFEGSWDQFRHVLHHELVHAHSSAMIWGTGIGSLIGRAQSPPVPLWFEEGLAEYASSGWTSEADAFMRDAVLTGYLPDLDRIYGGILAYKGGQSFFHYFEQTYGAERIGEVMHNFRLVRQIDRAFLAAVGQSLEELSHDWHLWLKRTYWPEIARRRMPGEFALPLTDHRKERSVYNVFPALSPTGDRVAFISDRGQTMDLYVLSTLDGRVVSRLGKGEQVGKFEEMKVLRGGISWNADGTQLVLAAKGGRYDQMYIVEAASGRLVREINPRLDGVFEPAWHPGGEWLAFVGIVDGRSDLYLYDLRQNRYERLTDSPDSKSQPAWSPDGRWLAFVSDAPIPGFPMHGQDLPFSWGPRNIYRMDFEEPGRPVERIVSSPFDDTSPTWGSQGQKLAFLSNRTGVRNLYLKDLEEGSEEPITNIMTGIETAHWSPEGRSIAFSAFHNGGFDLFLLRSPQSVRLREPVPPTPLVQSIEQEMLREAARPLGYARADTLTIRREDLDRLRFRPLVPAYGYDRDRGDREKAPLLTRELSGGVRVSEPKPYRVRLTPDLLLAQAGYFSYFGLAGSTYLEMSDILGNHQLSLMTSLWSTFDNSNYHVAYRYLRRRLNVGGGLFYYNYFYVPEYRGRQIYGDRNYGGVLLLSWPFSRFLRVDLETTFLGIYRRVYSTGPAERSSRQILLPRLRLVGDNTVPGVTGYINGNRFALTISHSPDLLARTLAFTSLEGDWRSYRRVGRDHSLAIRVAAGSSIGRDPQRYYLGGNGFWWGPQYVASDLYQIENLYFASFQAPLRGYDFYEFNGSRFALTNLEYRFPLIKVLTLGWPVPLTIPNIRGAIFWDMGMAWDDWTMHPFTTRGSGIAFDDLKSGLGLGGRVNLGFLIFRVDVAWEHTLRRLGGRPHWYIALGPEF